MHAKLERAAYNKNYAESVTADIATVKKARLYDEKMQTSGLARECHPTRGMGDPRVLRKRGRTI